MFVQLHLQGRSLLPEPVTWIPERARPYFRVTEAPMSMPWFAPPGETVLTVDFGAEVGDAIWSADDAVLATTALDGLAEIVPDIRQRYIGATSTRTPIAYPVYALRTEPARLAIPTHGIGGLVSAGRNGEFAHLLMEDVYWRTLRIARALARYEAG